MTDWTMDVDAALLSRRSVRGFRPDPVPRSVIVDLLAAAARAPSGTNMQPWRAYIAAGVVKQRLCDAVLEHIRAGRPAEPEYPYYPPKFREPYLSRRRKVGWDLYSLAGVAKGDKAAMAAQAGKNFEFFQAPVGIIFTIDKDLALGSWLDYGIFLGCFMVGARGRGLHTCPQAAWIDYHSTIRSVLAINDQEAIVCGIALGYEDESERVNQLRTERAPVEEWTNFLGFE
jgi:nitroreductase